MLSAIESYLTGLYNSFSRNNNYDKNKININEEKKPKNNNNEILNNYERIKESTGALVSAAYIVVYANLGWRFIRFGINLFNITLYLYIFL